MYIKCQSKVLNTNYLIRTCSAMQLDIETERERERKREKEGGRGSE